MDKNLIVQGTKDTRDRFAKTVRILSGILSLAVMALVIAQLFLPVLNVGELTNSGEYAYNTYSGIDVAFLCWPAFILGGELIGPNPVLIAGIVLSVLGGLIGGILLLWKSTTARTAKTVNAVLTVVFTYFAVTWLCVKKLVTLTSYDKFDELLYAAEQQDMYSINVIAVIIAVAALAGALANASNGYLIKQSEELYAKPSGIKKAMTFRKAVYITSPIMAGTLIICILATVLMNQFSGVMDNFFGSAEAKSSAGDSVNYYDGMMDTEYTTVEGSKEFAEAANREIVSEGITLLKNKDNVLPMASDSSVTLLGADFGITEALTSAGMNVLDKTVTAVSTGLNESGWSDSEEYASYSDAAIVTIYRFYGESNDAKTTAADGVRTELSLSEAELELLDNACKNFDTVIVLLASSNVMEVSYLEAEEHYTDPYYNTDKPYDFSNIKGALWLTQQVGENGGEAVAAVLTGEVNPSGHLTDTWISNFKYDPTLVNTGDFIYTNGDLGSKGYKCNPTTAVQGSTTTTFVEYEEGIYSGYRYYETAYYEAENGNYDGFDYDSVVVYPFGYGLSYTDFDMEYDGTPSFDEGTNTYTFDVKVTNTGDVSGKQVVQIYVNTPYVEGGVEKAQVVLAGYAKTGTLEAGASETVEITVNRDYICSYDYKMEGCYILDAGDYHFYLSEDAHSWADTDLTDNSKVWTWSLNEKIVYGEDNARPSDDVAAVNQLDDVTNWKFTDDAQSGTGYAVNFSRLDFAGTYPTAPEGDDLIANEKIMEARTKFDTEEVDTYIEDIIITDSTMTSYTLADMRGVDYDDPKWEEFIEQFSEDKLIEMYSNGNWQEVADEDNSVPRTVDLDGPQGLTAQALGTEECQTYQSNLMIGATWNTEMAALMGTSVAYEMMAYGWTGWYGPGNNIHRTAFCGRNTEYFSEDAVLSGTMCASEVSSASEKGIICFTKHYAVNNQEINRQGNLCTWVNEQACREVYLRAWESYVKDCTMTVQYYEGNGQTPKTKEMPAATGIMTSYNLIGADWTAASTELCVNILRNEWGYTGTSLTDAINNATEYMDPTAALYSGGTDLCLSQVTLGDTDNDLALKNLQNAIKNILYNKANSNVLQINNLLPGAGISYGLAPWQIGLAVGWVAVALVWAACITWLMRIRRRKTDVIRVEKGEEGNK